MAVVNSEEEADVLRSLCLEYGPVNVRSDSPDEPMVETTDGLSDELTDEPSDEPYDETTEIPPPETPPPMEPANATVHIGFLDIFIEGEYLTVHSK